MRPGRGRDRFVLNLGATRVGAPAIYLVSMALPWSARSGSPATVTASGVERQRSVGLPGVESIGR